MIFKYTKFNYEILFRFFVIMQNVFTSFLSEYLSPNQRSYYDVIDDVTTLKYTFSNIIWDGFSYLTSNWNYV